MQALVDFATGACTANAGIQFASSAQLTNCQHEKLLKLWLVFLALVLIPLICLAETHLGLLAQR